MSRSPEELHKDGLTWLIVVAAGFFFGFSWVTGPLGWYYGKKLRNEAEGRGDAVDDTIRFAHIGGIVTTLITYFALIVVLIALVAIVGFGTVAFRP